ncbi:polygalacturonase-like [Aristolochia californica]|uniref:polygalacturonase-like n=1 Tax=Aristolochia californica TaxID=171875 RepID=UPI0035DF4DDD
MANSSHSPLSLLFVFFFFFASAKAVYNVVDYGASPGGGSDSSKAFLQAWNAACASQGTAAIYVPKGRFLLSQTNFEGPCKNDRIDIRIDGTLMAPNYQSLSSNDRWLTFDGVRGVSIYGGILDGQGKALWDCKHGGGSCPGGTASLTFSKAENILISGLTSVNSELGHIALEGCRNCKLEKVQIVADGNSPNTDGIHVQHSEGVSVLSSGIKTGDDCISIGPGTMNLFVQDVTCGPGHGISIGSLGKDQNEDGVQNVTVRSVVFTGTENGLRIKSWGRASNGFVQGVIFQDAIMNNVDNPIIIDQNYCPGNHGCPDQSSGVKISGVSYNDIRGTSGTEVALKLDCSGSNPCTGIGLENIKLTYQNRPAESSCRNVHGTTRGLVVPRCSET